MKSCALELDFDLKLAENFAIAFGISFQIKNDLDNVSANTDAKNRIYTAKDILGIENTNLLLDNYKEEMKNILTKLPQNIYRKFLEVLI